MTVLRGASNFDAPVVGLSRHDLTFFVRVLSRGKASVESLLGDTCLDMRLNIPCRSCRVGDAGGLGEGKGTSEG